MPCVLHSFAAVTIFLKKKRKVDVLGLGGTVLSIEPEEPQRDTSISSLKVADRFLFLRWTLSSAVTLYNALFNTYSTSGLTFTTQHVHAIHVKDFF
jgi:hypothetical protein